MNAICLFRNSFFSTTNLAFSTTRNSYAIKQLTSAPKSCILRKEQQLNLKINHVRKYSSNQNIPRIDAKQTKNRSVLKYAAGIIGACALTAFGAHMYNKMKLKWKGLERVTNHHYARFPVYYYRGYLIPEFVADVIDDIPSFKVREDDIWLVGFPKTGTTWLSEVMFLINSEADFEAAKTKIDDRFSFFEYVYPGIKVIEDLPSPRYIRTHLPFSQLPEEYSVKRPKTVYIARNPKDTLVSFHFFLQKFFVKNLYKFSPSFEEFCNLFVDDTVYYGPWWKHVIEGWDRRHDDHILYITYEDMKMDLPGSIRKIAKHLGKKLSDEDVQAIASHCSFGAMRDNNSVNYSWFKDLGIAQQDGHFMRKGKIGDWKNHLSKDIEAKLDNIVETKLKPLGISFTDSPKVDGK